MTNKNRAGNEKGASFIELTVISAILVVIVVGVYTAIKPRGDSSSIARDQGDAARLAAVSRSAVITDVSDYGLESLRPISEVNAALDSMLTNMLYDMKDGGFAATALKFSPSSNSVGGCTGSISAATCVARSVSGGVSTGVACPASGIGMVACRSKMNALASSLGCRTFHEICIVSLLNTQDSTLVEPMLGVKPVVGKRDPSSGGSSSPTPTPTPSVSPTPTATPTNTPSSPTPTPTPTATPTPVSTPTPTPIPTPSGPITPGGIPNPKATLAQDPQPTFGGGGSIGKMPDEPGQGGQF